MSWLEPAPASIARVDILACLAHPLRILFLDQGRVSADSAMGHVRVRHAVEAGLPQAGQAVQTVYDRVAPWTWFQRRILLRWFTPLKMWNLHSLRFHLLRGWLARRIIQRRIREESAPDVAHVTTSQIAFLLPGIQARIPCVISMDTLLVDWSNQTHGMLPGASPPLGLAMLRPLRPLERRTLARAPLCIAWTQGVADDVRRFAPAAKVTTLHPGLDLTQFQPRRGDRPSGPVRVLFVGGRWRQKGGPDLLAALGSHLGDTVELDVVTTEPLEGLPGLRVHRAEPGSATVSDLFARADVFCLPTTLDACPWVVIEALASGVPIVASRTGSIPELVGEAGIIVPQRNLTALRGALERLLEDGELRRRMGAAGRKRAELHYDARKNTPHLLSLLTEVANEHRTTRAP